MVLVRKVWLRFPLSKLASPRVGSRANSPMAPSCPLQWPKATGCALDLGAMTHYRAWGTGERAPYQSRACGPQCGGFRWVTHHSTAPDNSCPLFSHLMQGTPWPLDKDANNPINPPFAIRLWPLEDTKGVGVGGTKGPNEVGKCCREKRGADATNAIAAASQGRLSGGRGAKKRRSRPMRRFTESRSATKVPHTAHPKLPGKGARVCIRS